MIRHFARNGLLQGLKFANKLSSNHIDTRRVRMNVRLAAQTFSSSVADDIQFLMESGHPEFAENA